MKMFRIVRVFSLSHLVRGLAKTFCFVIISFFKRIYHQRGIYSAYTHIYTKIVTALGQAEKG